MNYKYTQIARLSNLGSGKYTEQVKETALITRYSQLLGKSIDAAWKAVRTPETMKEAHARKQQLIQNGVSSIAPVMGDLHTLLCQACGHLAISDAPRDLHSLYVAWLIASDLKSAISTSNLKIGDLRGAALTKSIFGDIATQVKIEVKQKVEPNGNHSIEDAEELMAEWFYFVFTKSIGTAPIATSTSAHGKQNCLRVVYDARELMIDGKVEKPLYHPKPFVELSPSALAWITSLEDKNMFSNHFPGMKKGYR